MSLNQELLDVFKKSLPEHANKSIIETFEENKELKEELSLLKQQNDDLRSRLDKKDKVIASASAENNELRASIKTEEELIKRENVLKERERELALTVLQTKYDALVESKEEIKGLVSAVFRNPVLKKNASNPIATTYTTVSSEYNSNTGNYDNIPTTHSSVDNYTTETTEEIV